MPMRDWGWDPEEPQYRPPSYEEWKRSMHGDPPPESSSDLGWLFEEPEPPPPEQKPPPEEDPRTTSSTSYSVPSSVSRPSPGPPSSGVPKTEPQTDPPAGLMDMLPFILVAILGGLAVMLLVIPDFADHVFRRDQSGEKSGQQLKGKKSAADSKAADKKQFDVTPPRTKISELDFLFDVPLPGGYDRRVLDGAPDPYNAKRRYKALLELSRCQPIVWRELDFYEDLDWQERAAFTGLRKGGQAGSSPARFSYAEAEQHFEAFLAFTARHSEAKRAEWTPSVSHLVVPWLRLRALVYQAELDGELSNIGFDPQKVREIAERESAKIRTFRHTPEGKLLRVPLTDDEKRQARENFRDFVRAQLYQN